ncbi:hypothetical protein FRB94_010457 [Tulasnella sp. JGI-2019a]|nr:hypothetical protein FRB93_006909 [Tulasnella sp. JGI-2019a]KAG8993693.1 hypothetical protein FRB94_010457 [Tulasnella sp. JGI-2019a]
MLLDGLDECNHEYASRLLRLIGQSLATLPTTIRFIITSRPEPHLLHYYDSEPLVSRLHLRSLDLEEIGEVEKDIEVFLKQELPRMVWRLVKRPSDWPGEKRRRMLIHLSGGLWIWVTTVSRMLADQNFRDPERQLDALLSSVPYSHEQYGRNTDLYAIYSQILDRACPQASHPELITLFQDVLGALCVVTVPVNMHTLGSLLCLDRSSNDDFINGMRTKVLGYLQAVLIVPDVEEEDPSRDAKPTRFIHKSFQDYLTDQSRCDVRFLVDIPEQHRQMAIRCMCRMGDLQEPNICGIDPTILTSEIDEHVSDGNNRVRFNIIVSSRDEDGKEISIEEDVSNENTPNHTGDERNGYSRDQINRGIGRYDANDHEGLDIKNLVRQHISSALQYACENWSTHVSGAPLESDDVHVSVDIFATTKLLYWLEVLSLLGMTENVAEMVEMVEAWLKTRTHVAPILSEPLTPIPTRRLTTRIRESFTKMRASIRLHTNAVHVKSGPLSLRAIDHAMRFLADFLPVPHPVVPFQETTSPQTSDISVLGLLQDLKNFVSEFKTPISECSPHIHHSALPFTPSQTSLSRVYGHSAEGGPRVRRGGLQQWSQHIA